MKTWHGKILRWNGKKHWIFVDYECRKLFADNSIISLGHNWFEHPTFTTYKKGIVRIQNEINAFFKTLGYEHIQNTGTYKAVNPTDERVALFAHQGFGIAFLSAVLDIPYPMAALHFDMCHTGMTAIEFKEENGIVMPKLLTLSSDSHLYKEGLPTKYNNRLYL